jgi:hypothetical protein
MSGLERARVWSVAAVRVIGFAVFLAGIGLIGLAAVRWLQTAHWGPLTVNGVLDHWPATRSWVAHPRSWQGLHRIVSWTLRVPVFIIVTLVGAAIFLIASPRSTRPGTTRSGGRHERWF